MAPRAVTTSEPNPEIEGQHGEPATLLSRCALVVYGRALINSLWSDRPGFVAEGWLSTITDEDVATELCCAGWWHRVDHGYRVSDQEVVNELVGIHTVMLQRAARCDEAGGHTPDADNLRCAACLKMLTAEP